MFDFPEEGNGNDLVPSREAHIALREGNYVTTLPQFWDKVTRDVILCFENTCTKGLPPSQVYPISFITQPGCSNAGYHYPLDKSLFSG